jgi:type III secretion protein L
MASATARPIVGDENLPAPTAPRLRPTGPIVPAAEVGIWSEARAGLAAVRQHALDTRDWANDLVAQERARGYAEGRAAGAEEAARLLAETAQRSTAHLAALERGLPDLVHGLVADILGRFEPGDLVARAVRHAVERLRPEAEAVLRCAPGDVEAMRDALGDAAASPLRIEPDPALAPGECCLRSAVGSVELGIEAQLRALRAGLATAAPGASEARA